MRPFLPVLAALLLCFSSTALASTDTACWNRDLERLDYYVNPPERGDNQFFTAISDLSDNTNVTLLYPATASMKGFVQRLYRIRKDLGGPNPTGCTNAYFNSLQYFMPTNIQPPAGAASLQGPYSSLKAYPDPAIYAGGSDGQKDGLTADRAYRYLKWPAPNTAGTAETFVTACAGAASSATRAVECEACLATNGYWLNPDVSDSDVSERAGVFRTNFLRFHPPKWALLSLAYKRLVKGPLLANLREAVLATNGSAGAQLVQKMLPQSCGGTGRPLEQKLGAIDGLNYSNNAKPIAEMLFNAAWYMVNQPAPWQMFTDSRTYPTGWGNTKSDPCNSCQGDFLVLFSDGRGDEANPSCEPRSDLNGDGVVNALDRPRHCSAAAQCTTLGMGTENDGNDFMDPSWPGGPGPLFNGPSLRQTPGGTCEMDFADDVARWMATSPISKTYPNTRVRTYVVGIGDKQNTYGEMTALREVAAAGEGKVLIADNFAELEKVIESVLVTIIDRATSFSSAAITSVQTRGLTSAFIPRFQPESGAQWLGTLSRFDLFNEFAAGCTAADHNKKNERNPNGDASCGNFYVKDADGNFVGENEKGDFVVLDDGKPWDNTKGWPPKVTSTGAQIPGRPIWEASKKLSERMDAVIAGTSTNTRKIYTVAPSGTTGNYSTTLVPFTVANVATIAPLLKLGGLDSDFCRSLAAYTRSTYTTENDCAADVIRFMHGIDVMRQNPFNRTVPQPAVLKSRPNILGDIFHSTPILVTPPVPTFLCDLGIANQCVASLYGPTLTPGGAEAYKAYADANRTRSQFVLVGSNDGMLHAFNAGDFVTAADGTSRFDMGSGEELWAFIPPDMLPKLIRYVVGERHELLVDGTAMVRDVWVDGSGAGSVDHVKQADEFHTVAVIGEREGGRHYVALDVTSPTAPKFLWAWPPPGTTESLDTGESWSDLGPAPPPIGPIATWVHDTEGGAFAVQGKRAREQYIVALGGGHDPAGLRGRSINMLDVWTGKPVYRFARRDSAGASDLRQSVGPVAAPVSLIDTNGDGLFDAAVVGDLLGQVWTVSMLEPGKDENSNGRFDNWFTARTFVQFRGENVAKRSAFFQRAVAAKLPSGQLRIYLGSGDRAQIKDPKGGTCGLANLGACVRKGCSVESKATSYQVGSKFAHGSWTHTAGATTFTSGHTYDSATSGVACADTTTAQLDFTITCGTTARSFSSKATCDWGATSAGLECPVADGRPLNATIPHTATVEFSRLYSIALFDSGSRAQFTTAAGATTYDTARLTDSNLANADTTTTPGSNANGWFVTHRALAPGDANAADERTASSALLLGGCVIWNTLKPNAVTALSCGTVIPPDSAFSYQADAITGAIGCGNAGSTTANATVRFKARETYISPQQPSPVISVNSATGEISYSSVSLEPGGPPVSLTVGTGDIVGPIHWLEVPRRMHDCRHDGVNCN
jgi:type IV pilus assembly protein PilY1